MVHFTLTAHFTPSSATIRGFDRTLESEFCDHFAAFCADHNHPTISERFVLVQVSLFNGQFLGREMSVDWSDLIYG